jgi:hypothetical protein
MFPSIMQSKTLWLSLRKFIDMDCLEACPVLTFPATAAT